MRNLEAKIMTGMQEAKKKAAEKLQKMPFMKKREGIDGILVTVGLCIIALILCVVMKDELSTFITTLVGDMTTQAQGILRG